MINTFEPCIRQPELESSSEKLASSASSPASLDANDDDYDYDYDYDDGLKEGDAYWPCKVEDRQRT